MTPSKSKKELVSGNVGSAGGDHGPETARRIKAAPMTCSTR
jgi:hypothetical protein